MENNKAQVGIIMGSDSDLPVMKDAVQILKELGVNYEVTVASAHRAPKKTYDYAKNAKQKGFEVIIAGAGGAAHLPGVIAALTTLPVIGVPIKSNLNGLDSLLSIVQMPKGVPVATVGIDNAKNAGILAAQILGIKYPEIQRNLEKYKQHLKETVDEKAKNIQAQDI